MNAFDRSLCWRALAYAALAGIVATVIVVATDEAYSTVRMRVARLGALAPALGAVGAAAAAAQAERRGELLALASLGAPPTRAVLGAAVGVWLVGGVATAALLTPLADPSSLFPVFGHTSRWVPEGTSLVEQTAGVRVGADGSLAFSALTGAAAVQFRPTGAWAAVTTFPLAVVAPLWAVVPARAPERTAVLLATVAAVIFVLHAVAAERLAPGWLAAGAAPMAATLAARSASWVGLR